MLTQLSQHNVCLPGMSMLLISRDLGCDRVCGLCVSEWLNSLYATQLDLAGY